MSLFIKGSTGTPGPVGASVNVVVFILYNCIQQTHTHTHTLTHTHTHTYTYTNTHIHTHTHTHTHTRIHTHAQPYIVTIYN